MPSTAFPAKLWDSLLLSGTSVVLVSGGGMIWELGWFGDLSEESSPNDSIFLKLECYVFGEGGTCTQKTRRDCSDNEDPRP